MQASNTPGERLDLWRAATTLTFFAVFLASSSAAQGATLTCMNLLRAFAATGITLFGLSVGMHFFDWDRTSASPEEHVVVDWRTYDQDDIFQPNEVRKVLSGGSDGADSIGRIPTDRFVELTPTATLEQGENSFAAGIERGLKKLEDAEHPRLVVTLRGHGSRGLLNVQTGESIPYDKMAKLILSRMDDFTKRTGRRPELWLIVDSCYGGSSIDAFRKQLRADDGPFEDSDTHERYRYLVHIFAGATDRELGHSGASAMRFLGEYVKSPVPTSTSKARISGTKIAIDQFLHHSPVDFWTSDPQVRRRIANEKPKVLPNEIARLHAGVRADLSLLAERARQHLENIDDRAIKKENEMITQLDFDQEIRVLELLDRVIPAQRAKALQLLQSLWPAENASPYRIQRALAIADVAASISRQERNAEADALVTRFLNEFGSSYLTELAFSRYPRIHDRIGAYIGYQGNADIRFLNFLSDNRSCIEVWYRAKLQSTTDPSERLHYQHLGKELGLQER